MPFNTEMWAWFKTAPLPVVLSICLTSFLLVGSYAHSIEKDVQKHKTDVAVAVNKADNAIHMAERAETKMDQANKKLDDLLEVIMTIRGEDLAYNRKSELERKKIADNLVKKEKK